MRATSPDQPLALHAMGPAVIVTVPPLATALKFGGRVPEFEQSQRTGAHSTTGSTLPLPPEYVHCTVHAPVLKSVHDAPWFRVAGSYTYQIALTVCVAAKTSLTCTLRLKA